MDILNKEFPKSNYVSKCNSSSFLQDGNSLYVILAVI